MEASKDPYIYVLRELGAYEAALKAGELLDPSLQSEGFIHASPVEQLTRVANKYYRQRGPIVCCVIDPAKLSAELKWEPAAGSLYPHIYGPLNMDAVLWAVELRPVVDEKFEVQPADLTRAHALES